MRVTALALAAVALTVVLVPAAPATPPSLTPIQPGGPLTDQFFPGGIVFPRCTLGFILRDGAGTWYALTAGHCVSGVGYGTYHASTGGFWGTTVVDDDLPSEGGPADGIDMALVRIYSSKVGYVSPAVRGYGGPTGVATLTTAISGDVTLVTGYISGIGYGYPLSVNQIQYAQHGAGVFSQFDGANYHNIMTAVDGYSGGPVIMGDDGQALGLVSAQVGHLQIGLPGIDRGPTVSATLSRLSSVYGYTLTLQTAPFTGIPAV